MIVEGNEVFDLSVLCLQEEMRAKPSPKIKVKNALQAERAERSAALVSASRLTGNTENSLPTGIPKHESRLGSFVELYRKRI